MVRFQIPTINTDTVIFQKLGVPDINTLKKTLNPANFATLLINEIVELGYLILQHRKLFSRLVHFTT